MKTKSNFRPAFTLVELLVVIGIIVLLISILLPAIAKAQLQSRKTVTLSDLHQIGIAMASYEAEWKGRHPTDLPDVNEDGRAFSGLELLAAIYKLPPRLFINPNTEDQPATQFDANGWPIFITFQGTPVTLTIPNPDPAAASAIVADPQDLVWHCSFAYDHEKKRSGNVNASRVYVGDRADYTNHRSYSNNWNGQGMCLLWTDQHAEFTTSKSRPDQMDPNIYHHNQYYADDGTYPGEGGTEVSLDGFVKVSPQTADTHLRVFSEDEDNLMLPNP